jgi:hypothetical protein
VERTGSVCCNCREQVGLIRLGLGYKKHIPRMAGTPGNSSMSESVCWQQFTFRAAEGRGTATDLIRDRGSATQDTTGPFADLYGCTSVSGNMKTSSTIPIIVKS